MAQSSINLTQTEQESDSFNDNSHWQCEIHMLYTTTSKPRLEGAWGYLGAIWHN